MSIKSITGRIASTGGRTTIKESVITTGYTRISDTAIASAESNNSLRDIFVFKPMEHAITEAYLSPTSICTFKRHDMDVLVSIGNGYLDETKDGIAEQWGKVRAEASLKLKRARCLRAGSLLGALAMLANPYGVLLLPFAAALILYSETALKRATRAQKNVVDSLPCAHDLAT